MEWINDKLERNWWNVRTHLFSLSQSPERNLFHSTSRVTWLPVQLSVVLSFLYSCVGCRVERTLPGKGTFFGPAQKEGGLSGWTGPGLCGEDGGADDTLWDQGSPAQKEPPPGLLPPKKFLQLQTPVTKVHYWKAEELICPTCHQAMQHLHLREE